MKTANFTIEGHEVTVSFAPQENQEVVQRVKQMLLSAFAAKKISDEGKFYRGNFPEHIFQGS